MSTHTDETNPPEIFDPRPPVQFLELKVASIMPSREDDILLAAARLRLEATHAVSMGDLEGESSALAYGAFLLGEIVNAIKIDRLLIQARQPRPARARRKPAAAPEKVKHAYGDDGICRITHDKAHGPCLLTRQRKRRSDAAGQAAADDPRQTDITSRVVGTSTAPEGSDNGAA